MAYKIVEKKYMSKTPINADNKPLITEILDTAGDLEQLGSDYYPGSVAVVADKGVPSYMLNASNEWKEI